MSSCTICRHCLSIFHPIQYHLLWISIIHNRQIYFHIGISIMNNFNDQRKRNFYSLFGIISAILALGHFVVLDFSITLSHQIDDANSQIKGIIPDWNFKQNIPFAVVLGVFAAVQFCSSLAIVISNRKTGAAGTLYYNSLVGLMTSFAIGVSLTILASEYNSFTRTVPKDQTLMPTLMPFYYDIQVDATATFLFSVPMLLFVFYHNLEDYLKEQRETNKQTILHAQALNKQIWLLALFLLNAFAHIAFIYNIYQFTGIENTKDYTLDNLADQYTFYLSVQVVVTLVALVLQIQHFKSALMSKSQLIFVATLAALFQFGSFILMAIKTVQAHLDINLMKDGICYFPDCDEAGIFRWEITAYSILTLLALVAYVPYFRIISTMIERDEKRDTLLTTDGEFA